LTEAIDTMALGGKLVFFHVGALAEFKRSIIRERTKAGCTPGPRPGYALPCRPTISSRRAPSAWWLNIGARELPSTKTDADVASRGEPSRHRKTRPSA